MVLLGILDIVDGGDPADWVAAPRVHHQFLPDEILFEADALDDATRESLRKRGHALEEASFPYGNMQLIHWDRSADRVRAASDPRGIGAAEVIDAAVPTEPSDNTEENP
jgi:gamma-glutamyltranspeptidase/glutathione hydrolase